jgi:integrase
MNAYLAARNPKDNIVTIYAEYSNNPKIKRVATGIKVSAAHWDNQNKLIKANAKLLGAANVGDANQTIKRVLASLNEAVRALYLKNGNIYPTVEQLNKHLTQAGETIAAVAAEATLVTELEKWIAHHTVASNWSDSTQKNLIAVVKTLKAYEREKKITLFLSTLTNEEIVKWQQYLVEVYDYANSSLATRVANLKTFLIDKQPAGLNLKKVKALYSQDLTAPIALSKTEVLAIRQLDNLSPRLEKIRDLMVIQIYTGLRYSDIRLLSQHHISTGQIVIKPQKTRKKQLKDVTVPIFPPVATLFQKYTNEKGELKLPITSRQKFSAYIKEVAQLVPALHKTITFEVTKGTTIKPVTLKKYEVLASHNNRKTFCTMLLDDRVPMKTVMAWSNHSSLTSFQRYIGKTDNDIIIAAELMSLYS